MTTPRLFAIPSGVPFLHRLAQALCDGNLIEGFEYRPDDPLALSTATIYVPTRRAARALRSEFVDLLQRESAVLPTIHTLGDSDEDSGFFDEERPVLLDLPPPVGSSEQLLELAQLISIWKRNLPRSVSEFHGENRLIAPASPADAVWLARSLATLLEAMETEERSWSELDGLAAADYAQWWQLTLEFLKIAGEFWPARLGELGCTSQAYHRNAVLRAEVLRLKSAPLDGPVIIAGSTGSIPATAELMVTVAELEQGAVVLPGLDHQLQDSAWNLIGGHPEAELFDPAICTHPQFGFYTLLRKFGAARADVTMLSTPEPDLEKRNQVISKALMPAEATAQWVQPDLLIKDITDAFDGVELIEAAGEREEALAIAIAMRLAAEPTGPEPANQPHVALVTPDRNLARRVACELQRFGIAADDSGGTQLSLTPQGTLLQLSLQAAFGNQSAVALVALMKHPLVRFGFDAATMRRAARVIERVALRGGTGEVSIGALSQLFDRRLAERLAEKRHQPHWQNRLAEADFGLARTLAARIDAAFQPLLEPVTGIEAESRHWAEWSAHLIETAALDEQGSLSALWDNEAGQNLANLLGAVMENRSGFSCGRAEWADMVPALMAGDMVKPRAGGHPNISIWGTLEARLQHVDTMILAGLNEGTWPAAAASDPFLSRAMKAMIGLDPPERRIGLAAHDFQMGLGTRHVILSRSARSQNAPTVASRWLQRLMAVIGKAETDRLRARGNRYVEWAAALDTAEDRPMASRPAPTPPTDLQPKRYSFSEVKTLRRDPYAIYARRILRLDPPEPLIADPGPAERGTLYHRILECFTRGTSVVGGDSRDALLAIADREFAAANIPDHVSLIWRYQFSGLVDAFVDWERARDPDIATRYMERRARLVLPDAGIDVTGIADRIDIRHDGTAEILDYKTGTSPSRRVAWTLLDPQLPLEAAALRAGAFEGVDPVEPSSLAYVRLRPGASLKVDRIEGRIKDADRDKSPSDLAQEAVSRLCDLVAELAAGRLGFASQVIPDPLAVFGREYDHLARVREWSSADTVEADGGDS
ncbi:MAG: double-strand break repair protein AddB [Alphaproteobacteria bacterium]|nr:double-strand break repair protein AddB [Alphaproteobacteria bacterium]